MPCLARRREDLGLIEIRVRFDLQHRQFPAGELLRLLDHGDGEIGDADMLGEARALDLAQRARSSSASGICALGQWISSRSTHGSASRSRLSSTERSRSPAASRLNQTLVVRKISSRLMPERAHAGADFALVAVVLRGVEMAIAEMQRRLDQVDAQILLQRHGAEPITGIRAP